MKIHFFLKKFKSHQDRLVISTTALSWDDWCYFFWGGVGEEVPHLHHDPVSLEPWHVHSSVLRGPPPNGSPNQSDSKRRNPRKKSEKYTKHTSFCDSMWFFNGEGRVTNKHKILTYVQMFPRSLGGILKKHQPVKKLVLSLSRSELSKPILVNGDFFRATQFIWNKELRI